MIEPDRDAEPAPSWLPWVCLGLLTLPFHPLWIDFEQVPHDAFIGAAKESGAPRDVIWMLDYLFSTVLDGRNAHLTDGVQRALGRDPRDHAEFARAVVAAGGWQA